MQLEGIATSHLETIFLELLEQLLDYVTEKRRYWKCNEEARDRTLRKTPLGKALDLS
jgi:hypothetical protein